MKKKFMDVSLLGIPDALSCRIVERINRFVVMIKIRGECHKAHITNSGRLHEFLDRGREGFCFETPNAKKTRFRLFAVIEKDLGALIDTQLQMRAFEAAQKKDLIPWLKGAVFIRRNPRLGGSLLDYLFDKNGTPVYVELKSAVLREGRYAMYPDCPTQRGQRHVKEMMEWAKKGGAAFILFVAALPHVEGFKPYKLADPLLSDLLEKAKDLGVQVKALGLYFHPADSFLYLYNPDLDVVIPPP